MPQCIRCEHHLNRVRRTIFERLVYVDAYECPTCAVRVRRLHRVLDPGRSFLLSLHTRCVRCGSPRVERMKMRDRIDPVSLHPLSQLLRVTGAPLNKCPGCRLQYYDWRPRTSPVKDR